MPGKPQCDICCISVIPCSVSASSDVWLYSKGGKAVQLVQCKGGTSVQFPQLQVFPQVFGLPRSPCSGLVSKEYRGYRGGSEWEPGSHGQTAKDGVDSPQYHSRTQDSSSVSLMLISAIIFMLETNILITTTIFTVCTV